MKVIVRICGGIGNQLFAYAAARRLAIHNKADLIIDNLSGFQFDYFYRQQYQLNHFNISAPLASSGDRLEPFPRIRRYIKRWINQKIPFEHRTYIQQERDAFDPRLLEITPCGNLYLEGYWQSERYFQDIAEVIRNDLMIKPPMDAQNNQMSRHIESRVSIALHVRFFDKTNAETSNNATSTYYTNAIAYIQRRVPDAHYFLFSDDINAARSFIKLPDNQVTAVSHNPGNENAYADLWLMRQCKHFIIANSTFSWWGAWLSSHGNKMVVAPGFRKKGGIAAWGFEGLLPDSWIKI